MGLEEALKFTLFLLFGDELEMSSENVLPEKYFWKISLKAELRDPKKKGAT